MKKILALFFTAMAIMLIFSMSSAHAHKGHAGQIVYVMKSKQALKVMLPKGAKLVKRKESLNEDRRHWANKEYAVDLDTTLKTYYLARDKSSGKVIGGAIIATFSYRHGDATIAIGLDKNRLVSGAALLSVNDKYLIDFEGTVGKGLLDGFTGSTIKNLADMAEAKSDSVRPVRMIYEQLLEAAVTLAAFMQAAE